MLTQTRLRVRKVKCDEEKPRCRRCTSTGRKCDGYAPELPAGVLLPRPGYFQNGPVDPKERRALQFFCEASGPFLSGPLDSYFWTHLVMQFSYFEPAVRHSLVSISTLYEQIQYHSQPQPPLADSHTALLHYNAAIREVRSLDNEPLVLLVCVLFICIEFLQGNREAALEHCRHGIVLLRRVERDYPWAREHLTPIFRRLSMLPVYFGAATVKFSKMAELGPNPIPNSFDSLAHAQFYIDDTMNRIIALERDIESTVPEDQRVKNGPQVQVFTKRLRAINETLDDWHLVFLEFERRHPVPPERARERGNIIIRYHVGRIWADTVFRDDEMAFDEHIDRFQLMVEEADQLDPITKSKTTPKFTFEMGFAPMLCFAVMKCRCLATRLRALELLRTLSVPRENMWDTLGFWAIGRSTIEVEHDIKLGDNGQPRDAEADWVAIPPVEKRVLYTSANPEIVMREVEDGRVVSGRMAKFYLRSREGKIHVRSEFIPGISDSDFVADVDKARPQFVPAPRKQVVERELQAK